MPRGSLHAVTSTHNGLSSRSALPRNSVRATIKKGERLTPSSTAARGGAGDDRVVGGRATGEREHAHVLGTGLRYRRTTLDTNNRQRYDTCTVDVRRIYPMNIFQAVVNTGFPNEKLPGYLIDLCSICRTSMPTDA